jgi:RND family efflux transporter MFP subunit
LIGGGIGVAISLVAGWFLLRDRAVPIQVVVATPMDRGAGTAASAGAIAVTANGYVVARTRAAVAAKIPGRLATLSVSEGSFVRVGTLIARLENADYVASVEEARANVASARAVLAEVTAERDQAQREATRLQSIRAANPSLSAQQEVEAAESRALQAAARTNSASARVDAAEASLRFAEATLENTYIRAPFTGTVLRKEAEVGEVVAPSVGGGLTRGAVVTMADLTTLEVEVEVNEAYIGRVSRGQEGRITLDAYPDTSFRGTVRQVVPTADRQRATVQVKVTIVDRDPRILPEMGSRVDFIAPEAPRAAAASAVDAPPRFRLPQEAVRTAAGASVVWIVRDGRLESRSVDAGPVSAGFREIRRGLSGGEQILVSGVESPSAGLRVVVAPNGAPAP